MKKNLRIVSAAAAALLAVAPIAAAGVSAAPVFAAEGDTISGTVVLDRATNTPFTVKLNDSQKELILQKLGLTGNVQDMSDFKVTSATAQGRDGKFVQTITFMFKGHSHEVKVNARFASQQGTPYFYNKKNNTVVNNGSTVSLNDLANGFTPSQLLNEISNNYGWKTSDASGHDAEMTTTASDVESQLVSQGLKRASNGDFEYPANGFNLKLTARSDNGNTASINVRVNANVNFDAPAFVIAGNVYYDNNLQPDGKTADNIVLGKSYQVNGKDTDVISNGKVNDDAVKSAVLAYVQSADRSVVGGHDTTAAQLNANQQLINPSNVSVDSSKVNSSVAGIYPVVITAKNPAGFTSKIVVKIIVNGPETKAPSEYVKNDGTKVYNINGNNVTEDTSVKPLAKGAAVYTFGKVTVNGVEYTEINKKGSNQWVKSSDLTTTAPATTQETGVSKTIMHVASIYDKNGKKTSDPEIHAYNTVSVVATPVELKDASGKSLGRFYKVANKDQYIKVGNIDGTSRTLGHNAYLYKRTASGKFVAKTYKRTVKRGKKHVKKTYKRLARKGTQQTTYGSPLYGKKYYRVNRNEYIKVANFR